MLRITATVSALVLTLAACGSDSPGSDTTTSSTPASTAEATTTTSSATTATEAVTTTAAETTTSTAQETTTTGAAAPTLATLAITQVAFGDHVTITNNTDSDVDLSGWWLCNRPAYIELSGSLAPGESVDIQAGDLLGLTADGGEVGLYDSRSFGDSGAMLDYVAWGSGGGRESVAVGAGLWAADASAPSDGAGIVRVADAAAAESWVSG